MMFSQDLFVSKGKSCRKNCVIHIRQLAVACLRLTVSLYFAGIKTLSVRLERQQENAKKIALWLKNRPEVTEVYYPGLEDHPGYEVNRKQATGAGSMLSFRVDTVERTRKILESVKLISYAERPWQV